MIWDVDCVVDSTVVVVESEDETDVVATEKVWNVLLFDVDEDWVPDMEVVVSVDETDESELLEVGTVSVWKIVEVIVIVDETGITEV